MSDLVYYRDTETDEDGIKAIKEDFYRVFTQATPSEIWDAIFPNAIKFSSVTVCDINGYEIECVVKRISETHTQLIFNAATSGTAYFN